MSIRFTRRLVELLWFGRQSAIIAQSLVATVPIIITLLINPQPVFFPSYTTFQLIILLVVVVSITASINFWLLSKAGASTYSPLLHSPNYILKSVVLNLLVGCVIVYIGYLLLVYPKTEIIIPTNDGFLAGGILSSIYSFLLAGANATASLSRTDKNRKENLIDRLLSECEKLQSSAKGAIEADTDAINGAVLSLKTEFSNEPMHDALEVEQRLNEWYEEFQKYNTGGQRKMVGSGVGPGTEMSEKWETLNEQYQFVREQLSDMQTSAFNDVTNGQQSND
jgi:hypothetical protein